MDKRYYGIVLTAVLALAVALIVGVGTWAVGLPIHNKESIQKNVTAILANTSSVQILDIKYTTKLENINGNLLELKGLVGEIRRDQIRRYREESEKGYDKN